MKVVDVQFTPAFSSFYFDDQAAIKAGAGQDGFTYVGKAATPGFDRIRQSGEAVSILLKLENGLWAEGDCAAVQYSGAAGRDPLFAAARYVPWMNEVLRPLLIGRNVTNFVGNARFFDSLEYDGSQIHTAIRYGLSQALLDATAKSSGRLKVEVICDEYGLPIELSPLALFGQSGDDRYNAVDKMIMKRVDVLPHGLINNVVTKLGKNGGKLKEYVTWLTQRILQLRNDRDYVPTLHIDVYGTIGMIFDNDSEKIAAYLTLLEARAAPFSLYIEGPVDAGGRAAQIALLGEIRRALRARASTVKIVADEWCNTYSDIVEFVNAACCDMVQIKTPDLGSIHNTIEAVLYCHAHKVEAYQGGTCNETDISARTCLHVAQATRPQRVLVKPGMGFDEGMTIVANEMRRNLSILQTKIAPAE
ncbi:MAG: methylaspartate ammonia-lyase [Mesorhizobium sp.]|uniref:methylaspartate ammonia-lyase n=1 Tax=Mesorhizobium sp. TaxID=1871066 RepID=UPI000FE90B0A|nr:methylaspartate ammonia-lyase [Mesorhizobium sp.]RWA98689.1 MAG: methylaspartate ammonia-lyase [Mesorhizobium sp.]RWB10991.1 MAG: methylaspartate ammonia-lyase [Mesorhizobium sp.]